MQRWLCSGFAGKDSNMEQKLIKQLRQADKESGLLAKLLHLSPKPVAFPDLLAQKVIDSHLEHIHFVEGEDKRLKKPVGLLWFTDQQFTPDVNYDELSMSKADDEIAGAWDEHGFAFKVVGETLIAKLKAFADKLKAGQGCFAGLFLADIEPHLGGVIVALHTELRPEHKAAIAKAQEAYENSMLLKSRSRVDELHALAYPRQDVREPHLKVPGHMWPVWKDGVVGNEVLYALNPYSGVKARYWGPYSFEQLREWIVAKDKFELVPVARTKAAT